MEKTVTGRRRFNPARYGMLYCPACKGNGKFFHEAVGVIVCKICGGFGFIRKEKENNLDDHIVRADTNHVEFRKG